MIEFERVNPENNAESDSFKLDLTPVLLLVGGYLVANAALSLLGELVDSVSDAFGDDD